MELHWHCVEVHASLQTLSHCLQSLYARLHALSSDVCPGCVMSEVYIGGFSGNVDRVSCKSPEYEVQTASTEFY